VEATATQQKTTELETTVSASSSKDGMSRHDETTPVLKVWNLKRLQGEKRISLPLPPGCRYITTEPMELSGSEESDIEREILFDKDRIFAKYTGDDLSEFGDDN
jgi:hypothetical protein